MMLLTRDMESMQKKNVVSGRQMKLSDCFRPKYRIMTKMRMRTTSKYRIVAMTTDPIVHGLMSRSDLKHGPITIIRVKEFVIYRVSNVKPNRAAHTAVI